MPEHSRLTISQHSLTFPLLHDPANELANRFRLVFRLPEDLRQQYREFGLDLAAYNGDDSWTLPVPATYVVDRCGVIRFVDVHPDHTQRTDPELTLAAIQAL